MADLKALREQAGTLAKEIRRLSDEDKAVGEDGNFTEAWNKANADYNALAKRIEAAQASAVIDKRMAESDAVSGVGKNRITTPPIGGDGATEITDKHRSLALNAWCRTQLGYNLTDEHRQACAVLQFNPAASQLDMPLLATSDFARLQSRFRSVHPSRAVQHCSDFRATLTIGSGPAGAYLIPPETLIRQIEINMLAFGGMRQVSETIRTASGERLSWPTADDTSNTGAQLGESVSIGSSVDPTFGKVYWDAYKFSSKPILVPYELLQDSAFDLPSLIGAFFGERLGRITNTKYTTGTGAATPKGIITAATTFSAASATAIAGDDLLGLVHSVDPAYRSGAGFMLHDTILLTLRKLKDGNGMYLWQSGLREGVPDVLLGYPLTNNQDMASTMSSGTKTILFGQLSKYKIRSVGTMRMYRLQERYRDNDQDGFIAFIREDGNLLTSTTAPVKVLTH